MSSNRRGSQEAPHVRADGVETRAVTVHLPVELAMRLRVEAAELGVSVSRLVEQCLPPPAANRQKLRRDEGGERITAYLPPDLAEEVRVRCARERRSMSDLVTQALREATS